jgi:hypothetical protein
MLLSMPECIASEIILTDPLNIPTIILKIMSVVFDIIDISATLTFLSAITINKSLLKNKIKIIITIDYISYDQSNPVYTHSLSCPSYLSIYTYLQIHLRNPNASDNQLLCLTGLTSIFLSYFIFCKECLIALKIDIPTRHVLLLLRFYTTIN